MKNTGKISSRAVFLHNALNIAIIAEPPWPNVAIHSCRLELWVESATASPPTNVLSQISPTIGKDQAFFTMVFSDQ
ncbi:hypothetical protein [Silvimonas amylolytica]|uniref:Uncharacterized protein n=1 Tax=Silvimonas amylolytica TaxID=449663 RepID=A0ABQ2PKS1_9NEIS|nr:hypothetical protein [Silvimonas amylolytica]GGP25806.1 hypothetical protein GCM10010971_16250 [Silvimonas amylolytica]